MRLILIIALIFTHILTAPAQNSETSNTGQTNQTLKSIAPFPVGAAVGIKLLKTNPTYRKLVAEQFNSITAENVMKFKSLHPSLNEFKFANADEIVAFAQANNMRVHGHTLLWAMNNPDWVKNFQGDKAAWKKMLKTHIQTIVTHFKGKVASWDVVNEAFADGGTYKKSIWLEKLGPEYIELAFRYAHEADPNALLFYNDYGQEYVGKKMRAILNMVSDFKRRGVPIDGLGMQMHIVLRLPDANIQKSITLAASTGLLVHLSEFEISVKYQMKAPFEMNDYLAWQQAQKYKAVFKAYSSIPKKQQFGITTWNVGDADSYRNSKGKNHDHPMLFDNNYKPKAAFNAVIESLENR
jgi:endo-1,4-beta-xylanase